MSQPSDSQLHILRRKEAQTCTQQLVCDNIKNENIGNNNNIKMTVFVTKSH